MRHLPMPDGVSDRVVQRQCQKQGWGVYSERWLAALAAYRTAGGNPWLISPAAFEDAEKAALSGLYDSRRGGGHIARIRNPPGGYSSCPVCGSSGGRSLDHALPRAVFPEFSIIAENLLPACTICNSDVKGVTYRGVSLSERLIHPYYDSWVTGPLWQIQFGPDLDALVFKPIPCAGVPFERTSTVQYHLDNVLGDGWRESSRRYWGTLPLLIRNRLGVGVTPEMVRGELNQRLLDEIFEHGENAWTAGFLRGALDDARVPAALAEIANNLPL